ncbi:MAG TPA: serine/threonine-protein kinase [Euzebya sp.]|nr:serine/threonine-protein kinase [Euzebya sp.]
MSDPQHNDGVPRTAPDRGPATSDLLANRYVLEEHVATGGMAAVWRAHDEVLARTVAVKILHADLSRQEAIRERFRREAVAAAKLVHPGIVSLFDTGVDGSRVYLVIEYIEGQSLADVLDAEQALDPGEAARIGARVASALAHAHDRGIVHRDIKPANILLGPEGGVKVTDFGIAKAALDTTLTATGRVMGTAAYVAPEQLRGHAVDGRADLYSLGLVLFEALTGRRAFAGADPVAVAEARLHAGPLRARSLRADVPRGLDDVISALTAPDPADRPRSATDVIELLRPFETPTAVPPLTPQEEEDDGTVRSELRWLLPVGGLLLLAAALVAVGVLGGVIEDGQITSLQAQTVAPTPEPVPVDAPERPDDPTPATVSLPLVEITAFDPQGDDGVENDARLPNLVDGAPSTTWATTRYNTPDFGNLKEGVGFHVDLGGRRTLASVSLDVPQGGFDLELRVAARVDDDPAAWVTVAAVEEVASGSSTIELSGQPPAQYLLVWITGDLQPFETGFNAEIGEIRVEALAS